MLATTIVAAVIAAISAAVAVLALRQASRSADAADRSVEEARRSADAAECAAEAAAISAEADRAEDHRRRKPELQVVPDAEIAHDASSVIYRVVNLGPTDFESVVVHRPVLGEVEGRIVHPVARTGADWADEAEIGPIALGEYGRFTLSLGAWRDLPQFHVKIVCAANGETWPTLVPLDATRRPAPVLFQPLDQ